MFGWLCCPFFLFQNTLLSRKRILINTLTSLFFIAHKRPARYWWSASPPGNIHITTSWARRLSERLHGTTLLQNTPRFLTHERFISISHSFFARCLSVFLSITITDYQITAKRRCVPRARLSPTEWPWAGVVSLPLPGESRPLPYTPATPPTPSHRLPAKQQVLRKPPSLPSYVLLSLSHHHYSDFSWPPPSKLFPCDHCATSFSPTVRVVAPSNMARGRGECWCFQHGFSPLIWRKKYSLRTFIPSSSLSSDAEWLDKLNLKKIIILPACYVTACLTLVQLSLGQVDYGHVELGIRQVILGKDYHARSLLLFPNST